MDKLKIAVLLAAVVYAGLCFVLFLYQRSLIYFPQPRTEIAGTEISQIKSAGVTVNITTAQRQHSKAVFYFGGNAEDVSFSVPDLLTAFPDAAIYAIHYRGYGGSDGKPSEAALVSDALLAFDTFSKQHTEITVIGRSLGSGVAVQLASQRTVARLVLVTPYDSMLNVAAQQFSFFPVSVLLQDKYESWRYADKIRAPTMIIAAEHDEVIPRANTEALLAHVKPEIVRYEILKGVGHNTVSTHAEYAALLADAKRQ